MGVARTQSFFHLNSLSFFKILAKETPGSTTTILVIITRCVIESVDYCLSSTFGKQIKYPPENTKVSMLVCSSLQNLVTKQL